MVRRKALGEDPLSWIKSTIQNDIEPQGTEERLSPSNEISLQKSAQGKNPEVPKFQTYEIKLTLRLREDHVEFLSKLEREIMKKRSRVNRKERITKNSILRALIDTAKDLDIDTTEIEDEAELINRFRQAIGLRQGKNLV